MNCVRIPVLMYHRIGKPDHPRNDVYCISPESFSSHMHHLSQRGYSACGIEDFIAWTQDRKKLPEGSFLLTFDDGFQGVFQHAHPLLRHLGWPATVFLVASKIGGLSDWKNTGNPNHHPLLSREQIQQMASDGFSFHSHSLAHQDLTKLNKESLVSDLRNSRAILEDMLHTPQRYLAYPYGRFNEMVIDAARSVGFEAGFSVESGFNRPKTDPFRIRRIDVFGTDTIRMLQHKLDVGTNDGSMISRANYRLNRLKSLVNRG